VNITPTLEGGLCIDIEQVDEWIILHRIAHDALLGDVSLAERMAKLITDEEIADDWHDYVVPDLNGQFTASLLHVTTAINSARLEATSGPGRLWITPNEGFHWFSSLNQARLALEEQYHFGNDDQIDFSSLDPEVYSAIQRSDFYFTIQRMLLDNVMR
jgi:hypothetical protein